jgi:signal transduction histidine kinase
VAAGFTAVCVRVLRIPVVVDALMLAAALADAVPGIRYLSSVELVLVVLALVALFLRRRWPLLAWLLTVPAQFDGAAIVPSVLTLYALSVRAERRWVLALAGLVTFIGFGASGSSGPPLDDLLLDTVYGLFYAVGPIAVGLLVRTRTELSDRVRELDRARQQEQDQAAAAAVARERALLAREMHDVVSHQVSLMAVQAGALQVAGREEETRVFASTIRVMCVATLRELREMVGVLRAAGGTSEPTVPQPALVDLPELIACSGLPVTSDVDLPADLSPPVQRAVFRFVQEALTNARKHAAGSDVVVHASVVRHEVVAEVRNGRSPRPPTTLPGSGLGIVGLRERAELLGGSVTVGEDELEFVITMRVPAQGPAEG